MRLGKNYVSFTGSVVGDFGASKPQASAKIVECDDGGTILSKVKTTVNHPSVPHFQDSSDFVNLVADRIAGSYKNIDGKGLSEVTMFLPGATYATSCIKTPNLRDKFGDSLVNIDFSNMKSMLLQRNIEVQPKFKINVLQDSMGIGLSVFGKIMQHDLSSTDKMLTPGAKYDVIMTGGGCGIAKIQRVGNQVLIEGGGSDVLADAEKSLRLSDIGASVKASLSEFAKWFDMPEKIGKEIVSAGLGEVIFNDKFTVENDAAAQALKSALSKTKKYDIKDVKDGILFNVKPAFKEQFNVARIETINKYASAVARFLPQRISKQPNGFILTGPFAFAMDDCLKESYNSSLPKLIEKSFVPYRTDEYKDLMKKYDFKIICDRAKFAVKDNTDCADVLKFAKTEGKRKNLLIVNLGVYKKAIKNAAKVL